MAARAGLPAITLSLAVLAAGCASGHPAGAGPPAMRHDAAPVTRAAARNQLSAAAAAYLAIAGPANHRLDAETDGFTRHQHDNLAAAESDLRAEAATERRFDQLLARIRFPPAITATARALARANQRRAQLTEQQAASPATSTLLSYTSRHRAADAAVETQVRIIRRHLRLPPPQNS